MLSTLYGKKCIWNVVLCVRCAWCNVGEAVVCGVRERQLCVV